MVEWRNCVSISNLCNGYGRDGPTLMFMYIIYVMGLDFFKGGSFRIEFVFFSVFSQVNW